MLRPIDPQIAGLPAASIVKARDFKPIAEVFDLTLVLADVSEKALAQVKRGAVELLTPRMEQAAAEALAAKLAGGHWTHDYALTASEAAELGLPVKVAMPNEVMDTDEALSSANPAVGRRVPADRHPSPARSLRLMRSTMSAIANPRSRRRTPPAGIGVDTVSLVAWISAPAGGRPSALVV